METQQVESVTSISEFLNKHGLSESYLTKDLIRDIIETHDIVNTGNKSSEQELGKELASMLYNTDFLVDAIEIIYNHGDYFIEVKIEDCINNMNYTDFISMFKSYPCMPSNDRPELQLYELLKDYLWVHFVSEVEYHDDKEYGIVGNFILNDIFIYLKDDIDEDEVIELLNNNLDLVNRLDCAFVYTNDDDIFNTKEFLDDLITKGESERESMMMAVEGAIHKHYINPIVDILVNSNPIKNNN